MGWNGASPTSKGFGTGVRFGRLSIGAGARRRSGDRPFVRTCCPTFCRGGGETQDPCAAAAPLEVVARGNLPVKWALVVEDDLQLQEVVSLIIGQAGFAVANETDGVHAVERFDSQPFDIVILDLMLPSLDGLQVCEQIRRRSTVPVVILTAKTATEDLVAGLGAGADDYVTKPFEPSELLARMGAVLRRVSPNANGKLIEFGDIVIDSNAFVVRKSGEPVHLSATEFRLLVELSLEPRRVMTRHELLRRVWNYDYLGDSRLVDMAIKRLREKLEDDPAKPILVKTVRGVGYRLDPPGTPE